MRWLSIILLVLGAVHHHHDNLASTPYRGALCDSPFQEKTSFYIATTFHKQRAKSLETSNSFDEFKEAHDVLKTFHEFLFDDWLGGETSNTTRMCGYLDELVDHGAPLQGILASFMSEKHVQYGHVIGAWAMSRLLRVNKTFSDMSQLIRESFEIFEVSNPSITFVQFTYLTMFLHGAAWHMAITRQHPKVNGVSGMSHILNIPGLCDRFTVTSDPVMLATSGFSNCHGMGHGVVWSTFLALNGSSIPYHPCNEWGANLPFTRQMFAQAEQTCTSRQLTNVKSVGCLDGVYHTFFTYITPSERLGDVAQYCESARKGAILCYQRFYANYANFKILWDGKFSTAAFTTSIQVCSSASTRFHRKACVYALSEWMYNAFDEAYAKCLNGCAFTTSLNSDCVIGFHYNGPLALNLLPLANLSVGHSLASWCSIFYDGFTAQDIDILAACVEGGARSAARYFESAALQERRLFCDDLIRQYLSEHASVVRLLCLNVMDEDSLTHATEGVMGGVVYAAPFRIRLH